MRPALLTSMVHTLRACVRRARERSTLRKMRAVRSGGPAMLRAARNSKEHTSRLEPAAIRPRAYCEGCGDLTAQHNKSNQQPFGAEGLDPWVLPPRSRPASPPSRQFARSGASKLLHDLGVGKRAPPKGPPYYPAGGLGDQRDHHRGSTRRDYRGGSATPGRDHGHFGRVPSPLVPLQPGLFSGFPKIQHNPGRRRLRPSSRHPL